MYNNTAKRIFKKNLLRNVNDLEDVKKEFPEILMNLKAGDKNEIVAGLSDFIVL